MTVKQQRNGRMSKIKNFLCNTKPSEFAFWITLFLVLCAEAWFIGPAVVWIMLIGIGVCAALAAFGYGLYRAIQYLQTKCKE